MKKSLVFLLTVLLLLQLSGCTRVRDLFFWQDETTSGQTEEIDREEESEDMLIRSEALPPKSVSIDINSPQRYLEEVARQDPVNSKHYERTEQRDGFYSLSQGPERMCYQEILEAAYTVSQKPDENGHYPIKRITITNRQLSESQLRKVIGAFQNDNPDIFWMANLFGFAFTENHTYIQLYSVLSARDCSAAMKQMNSVLNDVVLQIPAGLDEYQREMLLHKWVVDHCTYDHDAARTKNKWESFTAFGALTKNTAVCEGYSRVMQLLLGSVGIECRLVNGESQQNLHMWDLVKIQGDWYHLDVTFNDSDTMRRYDYLNVTDTVIKKDHKIDPDFNSLTSSQIEGSSSAGPTPYNLGLPKCTATKMNYFEREAIKLNSLDQSYDTAVAQQLIERAQREEEDISLIISDSMDYKSVLAKLFTQSPYKFLYYIEQANKSLDRNHQINSKNIVYAEIPAQRALTVKLTYH